MDDGTESALGAVAGCRLRFFGSFFFSFFGSFFFSFTRTARRPSLLLPHSFFSLPPALLLLDDDHRSSTTTGVPSCAALHLRCTHALFRLFAPPFFGLSLQFVHTPQSSFLHPAHFPHLVLRGRCHADPPPAPPPSAPYPSQSGMDTHPASRYVCLGQLGISKGRLSLLLYSSHSFCPPSFSDHTNVLAASKDNHVTLSLSSYPSQSGKEIHPSSRYIESGRAGMLEGRFSLLHTTHSLCLVRLTFRTIALAAWKESMYLRCGTSFCPSQSA